ncbi:MAG: D-alanine--D-alanine ligase [Proteobacteria bacterium]|nr:D-alanine--D-alanine ligase [Pseudomonadota bacterium]
MRIGICYDLKSDYLAQGYSEEDAAEFDAEVTIDAIFDALASLGWEPVKIGGIKKLAAALVAGERWDAVFNFCEGMYGLAREAQVPTLLDAYRIPYVFSDALTMALTLDKAMTKHVVRSQGVPTAGFALIEKPSDIARIDLPFPLFLKPVAEGSGKGVNAKSKVSDKKALAATAKELLRKFHQPVLVETFLSGREFTVGITGTGEDARVLGVTEIVPLAGWVGDGYGLENKSEGWEERVTIKSVTNLPEAKRAAAVALAAWRALRCRDGGRIDIRCDGNGKPHFIEVNPIAGMRPDHSDLCLIANYEGLTYSELINRIMSSFLKRHPALAPGRRVAA